MKQLIFLITFFLLAGCGAPQFVQHVPTTEHPHQVITQKEIPVEITATLPATEHYGEAITVPTGTDETLVWEWPDATTEIIIENGPVSEHGNAKTTYRAKTTVKAKRITLQDTIVLTDTLELLVVRYPGVDSVFSVDILNKTFLYTVTNEFEPCEDTGLPLLPPGGSNWWQYLLWGIGVLALILGLDRTTRRKTPKVTPA